MDRRQFLRAVGVSAGLLLANPRARSQMPAVSFPRLRAEAGQIGKESWRAMLTYVAELQERAVKPPKEPFKYQWEEIGPGYQSRAFGHWDIVHEILDVMPAERAHALAQIRNDLAAQQADGFLPGSIYMDAAQPRWSTTQGHPPVWPVAVDDYVKLTGDTAILEECFEPLRRQIAWFDANRKADGEGYFYSDILTHRWESGVDEGVRFLDVQTGKRACIDATSHVYTMLELASEWARRLNKATETLQKRAVELRDFLQRKLYSEETGFFHDSWAMEKPEQRVIAFEGLWPMIVGAATPEQARRVIEQSVMNESRFLCVHPISTVGLSEKTFELRMWRGPAWNSMTYWTARGCLRYGFREAARTILERALDDSTKHFERSGTIWEFYHPMGGEPETIRRKLSNGQWTRPCREYLGHNPLFAMARLWQATL